MANTFKNYFAANVGTTANTVLTATTATTVIGCSIANKTSAAITASVQVNSSSVDYYLIKDAPILSGGSLIPVGGEQKLVLENGDSFKVTSNTASSVDVIVSVLEICLLYTSPSPRDVEESRMPSSA